jgi:stearoyl-CoA desaturase (delta-9 desaturase)
VSPRKHFGFIVVSTALPIVGLAAAIVLLWNRGVGVADLIVFALLYVVAGIGVSTGYHRMLAHRSFKTTRPVRVALTVAGAIGGQAPPIIWVAHHRRHHRVADKPGDPHSPWLDDAPGFRSAMRGLWHAHLGWLLDRDLRSDPLKYCPDIARDADMRFISRHFVWFALGGLGLSGVLGFALNPSPRGFLGGVLWGGLVRLFFTNHATYSVNSIGHYFGRRRFATADESRNVGWLALLSFGESWHNNHHAFPKSARHGLRWWEIDPSAFVIIGLEWVGLASDVVRVDRERQEQRAEYLESVGGGRAAVATIGASDGE